jgi:hypothetical protein
MNTERDKFLTEMMGECWHEYNLDGSYAPPCKLCGCQYDQVSFSTWKGFEFLFGKAKSSEKVGIIVTQQLLIAVLEKSLENIPDRFADILCDYLRR